MAVANRCGMSLITYLTRIHFADGVLDEALRAETVRLGLRRTLVLADAASLATGLLARVEAIFGARRRLVAMVCAGPVPTASEAAAAADLYRAEDCDGLIAIGATAAIDLAKACGLLVSHHGPLLHYAAAEGGIARIQNRLPPILAVPTEAGSGSEAGNSAAVSFTDGRLLALVSPFLIPRVAICDPTLTLDSSPQTTAETGFEALTHCIETYIGTAFNPPADAIALEGVRRIGQALPRAVARRRDIEARRDMMVAALHGALALQKGLGGVHAMSHALESLPGRPLAHGALNAVLLPPALDFAAPAVAPRYEAIAAALATGGGADLPGRMAALAARLGLPARLASLGLAETDLCVAAPLAERDHAASTSPRRARAEDYLRLLRAAL
jgi:alcohol dehydrogenase class IV